MIYIKILSLQYTLTLGGGMRLLVVTCRGRARAGLATAGLMTVVPPVLMEVGNLPTWLMLGAVTPSMVSSLLARLCCK